MAFSLIRLNYIDYWLYQYILRKQYTPFTMIYRTDTFISKFKTNYPFITKFLKLEYIMSNILPLLFIPILLFVMVILGKQLNGSKLSYNEDTFISIFCPKYHGNLGPFNSTAHRYNMKFHVLKAIDNRILLLLLHWYKCLLDTFISPWGQINRFLVLGLTTLSHMQTLTPS